MQQNEVNLLPCKEIASPACALSIIDEVCRDDIGPGGDTRSDLGAIAF
jgi:hypothetical protein